MKNQTLEELIEEYDKIQPCIDSGCGNSGIIANQVGEDEWEPQQCEYCYKIRFPVKAFIKKVYEAGGEAERVENKRLRSALDWIAIVSNEKNPHLGRPRSSDKTCIFCMAYLAINDGAYGEHIDYEALSKAKRDSWKKKEESK